MLFRPSFCANCGEKIERSDWGIFTSRRFCPVCESEFKGLDLIPRAIVAAGVLIGVLGLGSYLKSGNAAETRLVKLAQQPIERPASGAQLTAQPPPPAIQAAPMSNMAVQPKNVAAVPPQISAARTTPQDVVYVCGAQTKKGTPCSRRVHGPIRCYQHLGMPAMLPQEKLRVS
ncbi:MAG TPA: hypothetical protein VGO43_02665 [Pyrinomonadaceae bacterium]|jgi:hypothetical protein|nr:hypothetical protein [Pyrinomonadaceae bacterium]